MPHMTIMLFSASSLLDLLLYNGFSLFGLSLQSSHTLDDRGGGIYQHALWENHALTHGCVVWTVVINVMFVFIRTSQSPLLQRAFACLFILNIPLLLSVLHIQIQSKLTVLLFGPPATVVTEFPFSLFHD